MTETRVFLESSSELLDDLDRAYMEQDIESFTRNVHSLKSSSANLGCESLSEMAAAYENHCKETSRLPDSNTAIAAMRSAFNEAKALLSAA